MTWNLGCINFKILLVGPWPWAPHQNTNTIIFKSLQSIQGFTRGTLHPPPLKNNTVLGVHDFGESPSPHEAFFLALSILFWPFLTSFQLLHCSRPAVFPATSFGSIPLFLQYNLYKIVFQLNIFHRFFCIVIICNFLVFLYAIISNHFHNAIYSLIKHDYYPFSVGFISNIWSIRSSST